MELRSGQGVLLQTALRLDDGPALGVEAWRSQMLILHRVFEGRRCQGQFFIDFLMESNDLHDQG